MMSSTLRYSVVFLNISNTLVGWVTVRVYKVFGPTHPWGGRVWASVRANTGSGQRNVIKRPNLKPPSARKIIGKWWSYKVTPTSGQQARWTWYRGSVGLKAIHMQKHLPYSLRHWRWRQHTPPKHRQHYTNPYGAESISTINQRESKPSINYGIIRWSRPWPPPSYLLTIHCLKSLVSRCRIILSINDVHDFCDRKSLRVRQVNRSPPFVLAMIELRSVNNPLPPKCFFTADLLS